MQSFARKTTHLTATIRQHTQQALPSHINHSNAAPVTAGVAILSQIAAQALAGHTAMRVSGKAMGSIAHSYSGEAAAPPDMLDCCLQLGKLLVFGTSVCLHLQSESRLDGKQICNAWISKSS